MCRADVHTLSCVSSWCAHRELVLDTCARSFCMYLAMTSNPRPVLCLPLMLLHPFCRPCIMSLYFHNRRDHVMFLDTILVPWQASSLALCTVPLVSPLGVLDNCNMASRPLCVTGLPCIHAHQQRLSLLQWIRCIRRLLVRSALSATDE